LLVIWLLWVPLCGAASAKTILFVLSGASPTSEEQLRINQFQAWGHTVNTIQDSASQAAFDAAVTSSHVAYVPEDVSASSLGYKLRTVCIGVISEEARLDVEFGFSTSDPGSESNSSSVFVTNNAHWVSSGLASGTVTLYSSSQPRIRMEGTYAPGGMALAAISSSGNPLLFVIEAGGTLANTYAGNSTASGRRVRLPWGANAFSFSSLNSTGLSVLREAVNWASTNGLVAHWKLDDTVGTAAADSSGSANHGTFVGNPTWSDVAQLGNSLDFETSDGVDRVDAGNFAVKGSSLTLTAWIRQEDPLNDGRILIRSNGNNSADQSWGITVDETGEVDFRVMAGGTWHRIQASSVVTPGVWYHLASTYNGTTMRLYVNGAQVVSAAHPAGGKLDTNASRTVTLGDSPVGSRPFDGILDDVRVYDRVLTATEVSALHAEGGGLIGHWTFNEGTGTTIADSSDYANHASFNTGTPTWVAGVRGAALQFNGANDAVTGANFDPPPEGTVALWIRSDGPPAGRQRPWGVGGDFEMWQDPDGLVACDVATDGYQGGFMTTSPLHTAGRWYHLAAVFDSDDDSYQIYLNGQLHKSGISTQALNDEAAALLSFGTRTGSSQRFSGALDDFRIYNRKLSAAEIAEIYGLVRHWKLDEMAGITAADSSGSGANGTHQNGVSVNAPGPYPGQGAIAADYDGSNDRTSAPALETDFSDGFALAMWVKPTTAPTGFNAFFGSANGQDVDDIWFGWVNVAGLQLYLTDTTDASSLRTIEDNQPLALNEWVHCAVSIDASGNAKLYRNGVETKSGYTSLPTSISRSTNFLGSSVWNDHFPGGLHDVRVYNRPLSATDVVELHGLVGHWKFTETSGTSAADETAVANNGTYANGVTLAAEGPYPGEGAIAAEFDGTDDVVNVGAIASHEFAGTVSVAAWVRFDQSTSDQTIQHLIIDRSTPASQLGYALLVDQPANDRLAFRVYDGSSSQEAAWNVPAIEANHWRYVVGTYDGATIRLYVDGQLRASQAWAGVMQNDFTKSLRIGAGHDGRIRDARLYNRAISTAEIARLYGQVVWWKFDEVSGSVAVDASGAGNHATIIGTPDWTNLGRQNGALTLDGATHAELPRIPLNSSSASIVGWAMLETADTLGAEMLSIGDAFALRIDETTGGAGTMGFYFNGSTALTAPSNRFYENSSWHHFATVLDDVTGTLTTYIDGVAHSEVPALSTISYSGLGTKTTVGLHGNGGTNHDFTGRVDDFRIFNRAISPSEVRTLYYGGFTPGIRIIKWVEVR
jgi:hypothetical protein